MSTGVSSKIYLGSSEFILDNAGSITSSRTFITAPTGICAVWEKVGLANGALHYIHTDNQGSWLKITSESATIENTYSYDAWGRPRNPSTWALKPISITNALGNLNDMQPRFDRGYTGHEHMAGFGLINMNGRLYDPYLQRFLSPDPFVQDPSNGQNYNRYTYCLNNPLAYTDPTGYNQEELIDNGFKFSDIGYNMTGSTPLWFMLRGSSESGKLGYTYVGNGKYIDKATGAVIPEAKTKRYIDTWEIVDIIDYYLNGKEDDEHYMFTKYIWKRNTCLDDSSDDNKSAGGMSMNDVVASIQKGGIDTFIDFIKNPNYGPSFFLNGIENTTTRNSNSKIPGTLKFSFKAASWGTSNFPNPDYGALRHTIVSFLTAEKYGIIGARQLTSANEWRGLFMVDIPNLGSRLDGSRPWAFEREDFINNNAGIQLWINYDFWRIGINKNF